MDRTPVVSSNVGSVGYDEYSETMEVEFLSGDVYQYFGVPLHLYEQMMSAHSIGGFLNTYVKSQYGYARV